MNFTFRLFSLITFVNALTPHSLAQQYTLDVPALTFHGTNLFAGTSNGVFRSTNLGANWTIANNGLPNYWITTFLSTGPTLFAGAVVGGVYRTTDDGATWVLASDSSLGNNRSVDALIMSGTTLFAGRIDGVFKSTDNGVHWVQANSGLPPQIPWITSFATSDYGLFAGSAAWPVGGSGVYVTTNNGANWDSAGLNPTRVSDLALSGMNLFAATDSGVYLSTNNGLNWNRKGLSERRPTRLHVVGSHVFVGDAYNGIFRSVDTGATWIPANAGLPDSANVLSFASSGSYLFAGTETGIYRSTNYGESWTAVNNGLTSISSTPDLPIGMHLHQNYPNPFNPTTTIKFQTPNSAFVTLKVFDLLGREVVTLVNEVMQPGGYERNFDGSNFTSGLYFYRLQAGSFSQTRKLVLLK